MEGTGTSGLSGFGYRGHAHFTGRARTTATASSRLGSAGNYSALFVQCCRWGRRGIARQSDTCCATIDALARRVVDQQYCSAMLGGNRGDIGTARN